MSKFTIRTSCPGQGNKNFIRTANGGWNTCIQGKPTHPYCNVLANCVGYASGRFNEIINQVRDTAGCTYKTLNCNAEYFKERAEAAGLKTGSEPRVGAIMCWQKGPLGGDGAGHVAIVERVNNKDSVYTSESGYGSSYFWNSTRTRNSGNGWGIGGDYKFRCFIYLPDDVQKIVDGGGITPNVPRDESKDQIEVKITDLRVRNGAGTDKGILGFASKGYYNYFEKADANGYTWYRIADGQWIASKEGEWTTDLPGKKPEPIVLKYKVGDKMVFTGVLYANAQGGGAGQSRKDLVCTITMTYDKPGTTKPYNINDGLGWVAEEDLTPYVEPTPPTPTGLNVGDKVKIVGTGYSNCYGTQGWAAGGIGWTREIQKIMKDGNGNLRPYPYKVGNSTGTTGFYQASALEKK